MNNNIFSKYVEKTQNATPSPISATASVSRGKYSVGIVCSEHNGKRVTFTAALAAKLKLNEIVYITVYAEEGIVFLGASPLNEASSVIHLTGNDKKIAYNAGLVHYLIDTFNLDYTNCVSQAFHNIIFNDDAEHPMAVLCFNHDTPMISSADGGKEAEDDPDLDD